MKLTVRLKPNTTDCKPLLPVPPVPPVPPYRSYVGMNVIGRSSVNDR